MEVKPFWKPTKKVIEHSNIYKMMQKKGFENYQDFWKWSVTNKEEFWADTVENLGIVLQEKYTSILDTSDGVENAHWLKGAKMNCVDSCFQNDDDAVAVVYQEKGKEIKKVTQLELLNLVNRLANGLVEAGLKTGDYIAIDMPMNMESVAIYLAGIKAGMPVVTIADSFAPKEIETRLGIVKPKLIFTQDAFLRSGREFKLYSRVVEANAPKAVVLKNSTNPVNLRDGDVLWSDFISDKV